MSISSRRRSGGSSDDAATRAGPAPELPRRLKRVAIVAGEMSGDALAAGLIRALRERLPTASFEGVAGPRMRALGCRALYRSEDLAVMGLAEVVGHLARLLAIRAELWRHFLAQPPDVFIGVDAPDFNLGLERRLRRAGVRTVHYVSPTVWAWRQGRVRKISRAVDLLLALFPFEVEFYRSHQVRAVAVGHPLADEIPMHTPVGPAREALGLRRDATVIALLPGSRRGEIDRLGGVFARTAAWLAQRRPGLCFVAAMSSPILAESFSRWLAELAPQVPVLLTSGRSREVIAAANAVLVASGTATLEALLLKRPMVVAYRLSPLSYHLARILRLVKIQRFALPNLLAGRDLVEEYIQAAATPERLGEALLRWLDGTERVQELERSFERIHQRLRRDANRRAAEAVLELVAGEAMPNATGTND